MEKKQHIDAELLTPSADGEQDVPTLVTTPEEITETPKEASESSTTSDISKENSESSTEAESSSDSEPTTIPTPKSSKTQSVSSWRSKGPIAFALFVLLALLTWKLPPAVKWYQQTPRAAGRSAALVPWSILTAWSGDPDAAYSLQLMPGMLAGHVRSSTQEVRHAQITRILDRYLAGSSADQSNSMTRVAGSVSDDLRGEPVEALKKLEPVSRANPLLKQLYSLLLADTGDFKAALANLENPAENEKDAVLSVPTTTFSRYLITSELYAGQGMPEKALAALASPDCVKTCTQMVSSDGLNYAMGSAYAQMGKTKEMLDLRFTQQDSAHVIKGTAYLLQNNFAAALNEASKIAETAGNKKWILKSQIASKQGQFDKALDYANTAIKSVPNLIALEQRVFVLNKLGRYKEALNASENYFPYMSLQYTCVGGFVPLPELHAGRAEAFLKLNEISQAKAEANQALAINPSCLRALLVERDVNTLQNDRAAVSAGNAKISALPVQPTYR